MRIVFMGSPDFGVPTLQRLLETRHQVVAVYTQTDKPAGRGRDVESPPVKAFAQEHGLQVLQPRSLRRPEEVERLRSLSPDVIAVAAYGKLLPQDVLDIPPHGCLNVHPSLLPRHRGASPIAGAILAGDEVTGVTIILMDAGMDSGPILLQETYPISPDDTTATLMPKLAELGADLLVETLEKWLKREIAPKPQDESRATFTQLLTKEAGEIDWRLPAVDIWRRVRAYQPWPGCYTRWQGRVLKITAATPVDSQSPGPGSIVSLVKAVNEGAAVGVGTGQGILGLIRLQMEGKRELPAEEFVRGQRGFVGSALPS
ncbi:MAG: methionyl-tRNA formyltransferase [Chloroflexi bacterium]|nr:methionyl-tRNA formyltransferase [Chloroflexota bacterium]